MQRTVSRVLIGGGLLFLVTLLSCAGSVPTGLGIKDDRLVRVPALA